MTRLKVEDVEKAIQQLQKEGYIDVKVESCPWFTVKQGKAVDKK